MALLSIGCASAPSREADVVTALDFEAVVALSAIRPAEAAIARLDRRPFGFPLDAAALESLAARGVDPDVFDYLEKRARVPWAQLRDQAPRPRPSAQVRLLPGPTAPRFSILRRHDPWWRGQRGVRGRRRPFGPFGPFGRYAR
jgi:hypothetical protein